MVKFGDLLYRHFLSKGFFYASAILLNIVLANYVQADNMGVLFFFTGNFSFLILILSFNTDAGITYCYARNEVSRKAVETLIPGWTLIIALLLAAAFYFFGSLVNLDKNGLITLPYVILFSIGTLLFSFVSGILAANKKFVVPNAIAGILNLGFIIALLTGVLSDNIGLIFKLFFISYFLQGFLLLIYCMIYEKLFISWSWPSGKDLQKIGRYSLAALTANIVFGFFLRIDYWMIRFYHLPLPDLGNYMQVQKLLQQFLVIPGMLAVTLFPLSITVQHKDSHAFIDRIALVTRGINSLFLILLVLIAGAGEWLFTGLFGESFSEMYKIFYVLAPSFIMLSTCTVFATYLAGRNKNLYNIIAAAIAIPVTIVTGIALVPLYGIIGAGAAASVGACAYLLALQHFFKKETGYNGWAFLSYNFNDIKTLFNILLQKIR